METSDEEVDAPDGSQQVHSPIMPTQRANTPPHAQQTENNDIQQQRSATGKTERKSRAQLKQEAVFDLLKAQKAAAHAQEYTAKALDKVADAINAAVELDKNKVDLEKQRLDVEKERNKLFSDTFEYYKNKI